MTKRWIIRLAAAWCLMFGAVACTSQTHEQIKIIDGQRFLCTWTKTPGDTEIKNYRCEPFGQNG